MSEPMSYRGRLHGGAGSSVGDPLYDNAPPAPATVEQSVKRMEVRLKREKRRTAFEQVEQAKPKRVQPDKRQDREAKVRPARRRRSR